MLQTWSIAVDMQLFALGSVLLPLLLPLNEAIESGNSVDDSQAAAARWARWAWASLAVTLVPPFAATLLHAWGPMLVWSPRALQNPFADPMFYAIYVPTHMRAAPYVIGVLTGCVMLRIQVSRARRYLSPGSTPDAARVVWLFGICPGYAQAICLPRPAGSRPRCAAQPDRHAAGDVG